MSYGAAPLFCGRTARTRKRATRDAVLVVFAATKLHQYWGGGHVVRKNKYISRSGSVEEYTKYGSTDAK